MAPRKIRRMTTQTAYEDEEDLPRDQNEDDFGQFVPEEDNTEGGDVEQDAEQDAAGGVALAAENLQKGAPRCQAKKKPRWAYVEKWTLQSSTARVPRRCGLPERSLG